MRKSEILDRYTNWIALYPKVVEENRYNGEYDIWQYGYTQIEGINGKVDGNIMYRNLISVIHNTELYHDINYIEYYPKCNINQKSLVDGLEEIGENNSFLNRSVIAKNNGIRNYLGLYSQNIYLLNLLKRGELRK